MMEAAPVRQKVKKRAIRSAAVQWLAADRVTILQHETEPQEVTTPESLVQELQRRALRQIVLLINSSATYRVYLRAKGKQLNDRKKLSFLAEEYIPLSAEEMTVQCALHGEQAMAVAVPTAALSPWISKLEAAGIETLSVIPHGLSLLQRLLIDIKSEGSNALIAETDTGWEIGIVEGTSISRWSTIKHDDPHRLTKFAIALRGMKPETKVHWHSQGTDIAPLLLELGLAHAGMQSEETTDLGLSDFVLHRRATPWIDLRVGPLGPINPFKRWLPSLSIASAGILVFLMTLGGILWLRASTFEHFCKGFEEEQAELYRDIFPGQAVPVGIEGRLRSEVVRMDQAQSLAAKQSSEGSAFTLLHRSLEKLPRDLRFRVMEVVIDRGRLMLEGEARGHSDVEQITQQLKKDKEFGSLTPRTRKGSDRSVAFTITAELAIAPKGKVKK
ncbi:hypothetical protein K2Y11_15190 [bacterium]|nr:hypothetical protein [bacterium]